MSLLSILSRAQSLPWKQIRTVLERIMKESKGDKKRYRELLLAAVEKGDLDGPLETFRKANARADLYIKKG